MSDKEKNTVSEEAVIKPTPTEAEEAAYAKGMEDGMKKVTELHKEEAADEAAKKKAYAEMNVYQKLQLARKMFLERGGVKKSGKNMSLEFMYFELADIVPVAEYIFSNVGLLLMPLNICRLPDTTEQDVIVNVVNTDHPDQEITFQIPYTPVEANRGTNPMMATGSSITYIRRYVWMIVLDIIEPDTIDATATNPDKAPKKGAAAGAEKRTPQTPKTTKTTKPATTKKQTAPPTEKDRKSMKISLTGGEKTEDAASAEDLKRLHDLCSAWKQLDPEHEGDVQKLALQTAGFKKGKAADVTAAIKLVEQILQQYQEVNKK